MIPWIGEFRDALDDEYGPRPRVAALATVDEHGRPRVRSVICRRVEENGTLWICSDSRSAKNAQLRRNPTAEAVFWLASRREQYRLAGRIELLAAEGRDSRRDVLWADLSDPARALFIWPEPGADHGADPARFATALPSDAPVPGTFELLVLHPEDIEHLDLKTHPHRLRSWQHRAD